MVKTTSFNVQGLNSKSKKRNWLITLPKSTNYVLFYAKKDTTQKATLPCQMKNRKCVSCNPGYQSKSEKGVRVLLKINAKLKFKAIC